MIKTTDSYGKTIRKSHKIAVVVTTILSLIILVLFAVLSASGCASVQIRAKSRVVNKYYYQLSDGTGIWSDQDFATGDYVCTLNQTGMLAQN